MTNSGLKSAGNLKGKSALITGASAGIGAETALQLAALGVKVFGVARRLERLKELSKKADLIEPVVCDLTKSLAPIEKLISKNQIDILVNNAGLAKGRRGLDETQEADIDLVLETNIRSLLKLTKLVLPQMISRGTGDIVNLGSVAGLFAYPGGTVYCASKFAVHGISQALRMDLIGKDIRVIEICPGMVETEFSVVRYGGDTEKAKKVYEGMTPLTAKDIAETILFSLSRPRHVNIQNLVIMPTDQAAITMVHRKS